MPLNTLQSSLWSIFTASGKKAVTPSVGRTLMGSSTAHASFFNQFASPPVAGTYLIAITTANTASSTIADNSAGGAAWTELNSGVANMRCYVKLCNATEPSNGYRTTYGGSGGNDAACTSYMEVLGANATNPDANTAAVNTKTCSTATSSAASDFAVILVADAEALADTGFTIAPVGYTIQVTNSLGGVLIPINTVIATKPNVGSGTIAPGDWTTTINLSCKLFTVLFKA